MEIVVPQNCSHKACLNHHKMNQALHHISQEHPKKLQLSEQSRNTLTIAANLPTLKPL